MLGCVIKPYLHTQQGVQRDNGMWSRGDPKEYPGQLLPDLSQESHSSIKKVKAAFVERQNGRGWKEPLDVIWPYPPAEAGLLRACCPGLYPDDF